MHTIYNLVLGISVLLMSQIAVIFLLVLVRALNDNL